MPSWHGQGQISAIIIIIIIIIIMGTAVAQWLRCCATNWKVAGSIPAGVNGILIDIKSFRSHYGPRVDSASNRNEYREYFLGVKSGRCVRLTTYHHPVPLSWDLGTLTSLNPLGLSRPVMGLLYLYYYCYYYYYYYYRPISIIIITYAVFAVVHTVQSRMRE